MLYGYKNIFSDQVCHVYMLLSLTCFFFKVTTHLTFAFVHVKTNLRSHQLMLMTAHHMEKTEI